MISDISIDPSLIHPPIWAHSPCTTKKKGEVQVQVQGWTWRGSTRRGEGDPLKGIPSADLTLSILSSWITIHPVVIYKHSFSQAKFAIISELCKSPLIRGRSAPRQWRNRKCVPALGRNLKVHGQFWSGFIANSKNFLFFWSHASAKQWFQIWMNQHYSRIFDSLSVTIVLCHACSECKDVLK